MFNPVFAQYFRNIVTAAFVAGGCVGYSFAQISSSPVGLQQKAAPILSGPARPDPLSSLEASLPNAPAAAASSPSVVASPSDAPVEAVSVQAFKESKYPPAIQSAIQNIFSTTYTPAASALETDYGWMIPLSDRPNDFTLYDIGYLPSLMMDVPFGPDVQLKLPGQLLDQAELARIQTLRYFEVVVKTAGESRARQHDWLQNWIASTKGLQAKVSIDPWHRWYFSALVQEHMRPAYGQLLVQSKNMDEQLLKSAQGYVEKITPLLTQAPTQDARMAWYGVLLQLQQGLTAYREQVAQGDLKSLRLIETYMQQYPVVARPAGDKPSKPQELSKVNTPVAKLPSALDASKPARVPETPKAQDSSMTSLVAALILVLIVAGYVYLKIRSRIKSKPGV